VDGSERKKGLPSALDRNRLVFEWNKNVIGLNSLASKRHVLAVDVVHLLAADRVVSTILISISLMNRKEWHMYMFTLLMVSMIIQDCRSGDSCATQVLSGFTAFCWSI
jgi:hypothetical protein